MGKSWLPEPSAGNSPTELTIPATVFLPDSDNEDENAIQINNIGPSENEGYQLLTDELQEPWDSEENDDDTSDSNRAVLEETEIWEAGNTNRNSLKDDATDNSVEISEPPRDIDVNFDQVRAAMVHVTLPHDAIPVWATEIPDSEWSSFLRNRITSIQQRNSSSDDCKS